MCVCVLYVERLEHKWRKITNPFEHKQCNAYAGLFLSYLRSKGKDLLRHLGSNPSVCVCVSVSVCAYSVVDAAEIQCALHRSP